MSDSNNQDRSHEMFDARKPRVKRGSTLAPMREALTAFQGFANEGGIDPAIGELVKVRASQINGCAFCLATHVKDAIEAGAGADKLATLEAWRDADWFTEKERAALSWTEALTVPSNHEMTDELYAGCLEVYSEQEMLDLTAIILAINSWNRFNMAFGMQPTAFRAEVIS